MKMKQNIHQLFKFQNSQKEKLKAKNSKSRCKIKIYNNISARNKTQDKKIRESISMIQYPTNKNCNMKKKCK